MKMPRIDPLSLLKCLSVLLGPTGGIKSKEEVHRLANLMTKFSKKLVSKCIYIQILKTTNTDLLSQFMGAGGWNLIHMWLTDGILAKNWALIQELLELLLLCPVDIERLKSNNCPKLIKGLSKEGSHQGVRILASRLVEQWLKIVKGEAAPNSVPAQLMSITSQPNSTLGQCIIAQSTQQLNQTQSNLDSSTTKLEGSQAKSDEQSGIQVQIVHNSQQSTKKSQQAYVVVTSSSQSTVPLYKITIRDGKQVLSKIESSGDAPETNHDDTSAIPDGIVDENNHEIIPSDELMKDQQDDGTKFDNDESHEETNLQEQLSNTSKTEINEHSSEATEPKDVDVLNNEDIGGNGNNKSSDKENQQKHTHKKEDKKSTSDKKSHSKSSKHSSSHRSSSSSSRSNSSSNSHKSSSSRSSSSSKSSRDKDKDKDKYSTSKHGSNSNKSKSERDKEKEKQKKDQAEKDKATLEKIQGQTLSSKLGKIPKKKTDDEKSKENKSESKKSPSTVDKKNISISIENKKNSQELLSRPKTVKTFNSKFRSTGLEEEVKPPPPRATKKTSSPGITDKKIISSPKILPLKRTSPLRETTQPADKKLKLALDVPNLNSTDEKKGGIKLIPPKPKPMVLQESDMFMDALTASTKSKEPRKRKRRTSISKDGSAENKRQDMNCENRDSSPTPTSPSSTDEKSPVVLKPNFKFYQDTLETEEDKEKLKDKEENDTKIEKDDLLYDQKDTKDVIDEDGRSNTPTPEDDTEDGKSFDCRMDSSNESVNSLKKENSNHYPEIRYVDGLRSLLILQKRKGPKKTLKWKTELESIRYFELDETERVNVTKTFTDAKQMEKQNEREAFLARKLSNEDLMEEKTRWRALTPIDLPSPLVELGKDSREKDIQYAREKGILQALYFNRSMIPDSAAEPDEERHHSIAEPKTIPLEDLTGNKESEKDFTLLPWPEPKLQIPAQTIPPPMTNFHYPAFSHVQQPPMITQMPPQMPPQVIPSTAHMPPQMNPDMGPPITGPGAGGWRTGDGKVVVPDMSMKMAQGYPQGIENAPMVPPGMMGGPPMYNQQPDGGYGMMGGPDDMGFNNYQGPPGPPGPPGPMYGPGPNFQGPRGGGGGPMRGRGGPPPGPGWYRGGGPPPPLPPGRGGWRGGWRGGNGKQPPMCRQFTKSGYCRAGDKCQYLHPGVNCPPF